MNSTSSEQVGKVFIVTHGMRRCLICDSLFTPEGAAEHSVAICFPKSSESAFDASVRAETSGKALED